VEGGFGCVVFCGLFSTTGRKPVLLGLMSDILNIKKDVVMC